MVHLTHGDPLPEAFFDGARARILDVQRPSGAIPWFDGGVIDPWNHTESAMGLTVLGEIDAARKAFAYLQETQLEDGSWWGELGSAVPLDEHEQRYTGEQVPSHKPIRDTNFTAYIATGVWHHYLVTGDKAYLATLWPHIKRAISFVLAHQSPHGDIRWAAADAQTPEDDALISGCSSIYKSLECAILIARALGKPAPGWSDARHRLGHALRTKPHRFDRTWEPKDRFSMDWYYPVLTGVISGAAARARLAAKWALFVEDGKGCRCVHDQPWVTVAESAELVMALLAAGERRRAEELLSWQHQWRAECGAYWMGYQYADETPWPNERPAWTAAAMILAADAVTGATPAARLFTQGDALAETAQ